MGNVRYGLDRLVIYIARRGEVRGELGNDAVFRQVQLELGLRTAVRF